MNAARRKDLSEIANRLDNTKADLERLRDEEQDAFDNMPEGLQSGDKGEKAQECIDLMESALSNVESAIDDLGNIE